MKKTEREWAAENSSRFGDDQQAYLMAQLKAIIHGEVDMQLNADHYAAWEAETKALMQRLTAKPIEIF